MLQALGAKRRVGRPTVEIPLEAIEGYLRWPKGEGHIFGCMVVLWTPYRIAMGEVIVQIQAATLSKELYKLVNWSVYDVYAWLRVLP